MADLLERLNAALAGRYRVDREVGQGGMATVYLAQDLKHHRPVAVKVLRPEVAATIGAERFLQEVRIAANLQHPHILPLHDSGEADGFLYYVMPFVDGPTLRTRLNQEGELPLSDVVRILRDITDAVAAAHAAGVVHRDIKPENIMLSGRHALVADFGVAKALHEAAGVETQGTAGVALGTPAYMAPEQAAGDAKTDHRADVYALGVVAYEMLTGDPPFTRSTPSALLAAQLAESPVPVSARRDTVPDALASLVMRCLAKKPADRPQRAEELLEALESLAATGAATPIHVPPASRTGARERLSGHLSRVTARYRWRQGAGVVAGLVALVLAGWFILDHDPAEQAPETLRGLAVLPFTQSGAAGWQRGLAANLVPALSERLKAAGFRVVEHDVAAAYVARRISYDSMARALDLDFVVGGHVMSSGDVVRLMVRLVDPGTGEVADTVRVEGTARAEMALVDDFVSEVGQRLQTKLGYALGLQRARAGTRNDQAYSLVVQAYQREEQARVRGAHEDTAAALADLAAADSLLIRALRIDQHYAEALIQRAAIARDQAIYYYALEQPEKTDSLLRTAERHATSARQADPNNARAYEIRGMIRRARVNLVPSASATVSRQLHAQALADLGRAVELDPRLVHALKALGDSYAEQGEFLRALTLLDQAYRLDIYQQGSSQLLSSMFGYAFDLARDEDAERYCAELKRRAGSPILRAYCELQLAAWSTTRSARPIADAWMVASAPPLPGAEPRTPTPMLQVLVAGVIARNGLADSARAVLARAHALGKDDTELLQLEAGVRVLLRDYDTAINLLRQYAPHSSNAQLAHSRRFAALPTNPLLSARAN